MKIIALGFKNPFSESGYENDNIIDEIDDINIFIGRNNSGKTNSLRSVFNLLYQRIDGNKIFRHLKVKLDCEEFKPLLDGIQERLIKILKRRDKPIPDISRRENRLRSIVEEFIAKFYDLFRRLDDYPLPMTFSMTLTFNYDAPNTRFSFDYEVDIDKEINRNVFDKLEAIFMEIRSNEDLISLLISFSVHLPIVKAQSLPFYPIFG